MKFDEKLVALVTEKVIEELYGNAVGVNRVRPQGENVVASNNPKEVVIGVGPNFGLNEAKTICGLSHKTVIAEIIAGIEEEGMDFRIVQVFKSSDVAAIGLAAAKLSGSGIGIGLQSKGTAIIHQAQLQTLSNIELFPQAPLVTLSHYRQIGKNAARYAKGENATPVAVENDPMVRAAWQVKAALMHIKETERVDRSKGTVIL